MATSILDHAHQNIIEITFNFPEFAPAYQKSVHPICLFLRYNHFQGTMTRMVASIFDSNYPKVF